MRRRNSNRIVPVAAALLVILPASQLAAQVNPPVYGQPTPYGQTPPYGQPVPNSQPSPYGAPGVASGQYESKNPLLMGLVVGPILQSSGLALANGIGMLFTRLFNAWFGHSHNGPENVNAAMQNSGGTQAYPGQPYGAPAGSPTQYGQVQPPYGQQYPSGAAYPQTGQSGYGTPYGNPSPPGYPTAGSNPYGGYPQAAQTTPVPAAPGYPMPTTSPNPTPGYPQPAQASPNPPAAGSVSAQPGANPYAYLPNGQLVAAAGNPGMPGAQIKAALVPSVIYTLNRLDPKTYQSSGQVDLAHRAPTLRTGDVFAIEYSTNVSGQVRIDNIDSRGQTSALGTYTVFSGHDNRIPLKKGIQLAGTTGTETFKMYFYPCAAADANGQPDAPATAAGLPACSNAPSPKLLDASRGLVTAKGAVNLDSPDPTIAVSAVTNYQNTDVTENDFQILHIPN
jgi:hypothetical protein